MSYQEFPIFDPRSGWREDRDPWLVPQDAFSRFENLYLDEGRILKRPGHKLLAKLGTEHHYVPQLPSIWVGDGIETDFNATDLNTPMCPSESSPSNYVVSVTTLVGAAPVTLTFDSDGLYVSGPGSGSFSYAIGSASIVWNTPPDVAADIIVHYEYERGLTVMGLERFQGRAGASVLVAWDTRRMWDWDTVEMRFYEVEPSLHGAPVADRWSGDDTNFMRVVMLFGATPSSDELLINNDADRPMAYSGTALRQFGTDIDGGGGDDINRAKHAALIRGHLVYFSTTEGGDNFPQRARWSPVNDYENLSAADASAIDAPTPDDIVACGTLKGTNIVVFADSAWHFRFREDDPLIPFSWDEIEGTDGARAPLSAVDRTGKVLAMGRSSLVSTNGDEITKTAQGVPDFVLKTNPVGIIYSFGRFVHELKLMLWTYVPLGQSKPTKVLALHDVDGSLADWDLDAHVLGEFTRQGATLTWNDVNEPMNDQHYPWNSETLQAGFPTTLIGKRDGRVYEVTPTAYQDETAGVTSSIRTLLGSGRLNPFTGQGKSRNLRLGYMDIFADAIPGATLTIRLYRDFKGAAFQTEVVDLTPDPSGSSKVRRRIDVYEVASYFRFELEEDSRARQAFDAVVLWMKDAGPMREVA